MKWLSCFILFSHSLFCTDLAHEKWDMSKVSETIGHMMGKNLQSLGIPLDFEALVHGMRTGAEGGLAPLNEEECIEALAYFQEVHLADQAEKNLEAANEFLENNAKKEGIISLEGGKLQYNILKEGSGEIVQPCNSPALRYKGEYLNGQLFATANEIISLDETISGLNKGIVGMREGEVRKLFIHPDLGYGKYSLPLPNSLLVFEIEVVKADDSQQPSKEAEDLSRAKIEFETTDENRTF